MSYPEWLTQLSSDLQFLENEYPDSMKPLFEQFQGVITGALTRHQRETAKLNQYVQPSLFGDSE